MAQTLAEVLESAAEGKVKVIYGDIKTTLRVPYVSAVFRALGSQPYYLQLAWGALKPNVQIRYFEQGSDALRSRAVDGIAGSAASGAGVPQDAAAVVRTLHYSIPKIFLAVAALRWATSGQQPRLLELPSDSKRQLAPGIPEGASLPVAGATGELQSLNELFQQSGTPSGPPAPAPDLAALAHWPDTVRDAWETWKHVRNTAEHKRVERDLRYLAEQTVTGLPFRMDISPHMLRHGGLSERDIDVVRAELDHAYRSLPAHLSFVAYVMVTTHGKDAAHASPFPAALL